MPETSQRPSVHPGEAPIVARLEGVGKQYGEVQALENIDFAVKAGELVALLGPNGAGKSTAIKLLLGLARPSSGQVTVFGGNPLEPAVRMRIGALLQVAKVPETLRVVEHIDLFASYYPQPLPLAESLAIAGLEDIKDRAFGDLSDGQKQRVLFALALCGDPDVLFLDEPTVGLDVEARRMLWQEMALICPPCAACPEYSMSAWFGWRSRFMWPRPSGFCANCWRATPSSLASRSQALDWKRRFWR